MELDHEKFEGVKELAEISSQIANATASLASLQMNERDYMADRELKLIERLKQTLLDSDDLIKSIGKNHSALVGYKNEVISFNDTILSLIQSIKDCQDILDTAHAELEKKVSNHEADIVKFKEATQREWSLIDGAKKGLIQERDQIDKAERLLKDRQAMFERTLSRTKK